MNDKEAIEQAYQATMQKIFNVFYEQYTGAKGYPQAEEEAEEHFKKGVMHLRHIHERALALLP